MKKIIGIFLLAVSIAQGQGFLFWGDSNIVSEDREVKQEMEARWKRIVKLDQAMMVDANKTRLEQNHKEYERELETYINYIKDDSEKIFELGDYYFKDNRYEKAQEIFRIDSTNIKNVFGAATTSRFLNENERALEYYNKAIDMEPNFYESYLGRGIVNRNMGNYQDAIVDFRKYLEHTNDEAGYIGLGDTYMISGDYESARGILEVGRNRYPNSRVIRDMLVRTYAELKRG